MWKKIKEKLGLRRKNHNATRVAPETFTFQQLENAYKLGYTDGKRDGLAIAREQATRSLREILKSQNKS